MISLFHTEVIKEVENNGDKLIEILRTHRDEPLEAGCLEKALLIATKNGNHLNVGRLIIRGATNLEEGLKLAIDLKKHSVTAILLLIQTARNSDKDLLYNIFNGLSTKPLVSIEYYNQYHLIFFSLILAL